MGNCEVLMSWDNVKGQCHRAVSWSDVMII